MLLSSLPLHYFFMINNHVQHLSQNILNGDLIAPLLAIVIFIILSLIIIITRRILIMLLLLSLDYLISFNNPPETNMY